jgi:uncharacterized membrane protein
MSMTDHRSEPGTADPRLSLVFGEAVRGIVQQQAQVESLHGRAATLVFATSFAASVLGSRALEDGIGPWDAFALAILAAIGVAVVILLWPYYNFYFRFDARTLLDEYVDAKPADSIDDLHRQLALRAEADRERNGVIIHRLRVSLQVALVLLLLDLLAWLISISVPSA